MNRRTSKRRKWTGTVDYGRHIEYWFFLSSLLAVIHHKRSRHRRRHLLQLLHVLQKRRCWRKRKRRRRLRPLHESLPLLPSLLPCRSSSSSQSLRPMQPVWLHCCRRSCCGSNRRCDRTQADTTRYDTITHTSVNWGLVMTVRMNGAVRVRWEEIMQFQYQPGPKMVLVRLGPGWYGNVWWIWSYFIFLSVFGYGMIRWWDTKSEEGPACCVFSGWSCGLWSLENSCLSCKSAWVMCCVVCEEIVVVF